jgi:hypothetical protein
VFDPLDRELVLLLAGQQRMAPDLGHVLAHRVAPRQSRCRTPRRRRPPEVSLDDIELRVGRRLDLPEGRQLSLVLGLVLGLGSASTGSTSTGVAGLTTSVGSAGTSMTAGFAFGLRSAMPGGVYAASRLLGTRRIRRTPVRTRSRGLRFGGSFSPCSRCPAASTRFVVVAPGCGGRYAGEVTGQTPSRPHFARASTPAIVFGSLALALGLTTLQDTTAQAQKGEARGPGRVTQTYDATDLRILDWTLWYVAKYYVEPERIDPHRMADLGPRGPREGDPAGPGRAARRRGFEGPARARARRDRRAGVPDRRH